MPPITVTDPDEQDLVTAYRALHSAVTARDTARARMVAAKADIQEKEQAVQDALANLKQHFGLA